MVSADEAMNAGQPSAAESPRRPLRVRIKAMVRGLLSEDAAGAGSSKVYLLYLYRLLRLARSALYDYRRYVRWSSTVGSLRDREKLRAAITIDYHALEKGLALPQPRVGFGSERTENLMRGLTAYRGRYGDDELTAVCYNVLGAYVRWNRAQGHEPARVAAFLAAWGAPDSFAACDGGGVRPLSRAELRAATQVDFATFVALRRSIRNFSAEPVDPELIARAVRMAQSTPSVCNRQTCRVHVFSEPAQKERVLSFQRGNQGFGHLASHVLIVTSDMRSFTKIGERFQGWIDGGMYSMTLVLALHSLGLGTCTLNWSVTADIDQAMRKAAGIPDNELVIMMIAVGHLPDQLSVAYSARRPLDQVLIRH